MIDLSDRTLTLPSGQIVPVAVGKPSTPTPQGEFSVMRKVRNPNGKRNGSYGGFGIQLSAEGGAIGIHGTIDQSSIGDAVSGGCIRVPAEFESLVFNEIKWTTPIIINE